MNFSPKKTPLLHADPTSLGQFGMIYNFFPQSILVRCMAAVLQQPDCKKCKSEKISHFSHVRRRKSFSFPNAK